MNKVNYMFWHTTKDKFNFGDDINPYIINKLTNKEVKKVMVFNNQKSIAFNFLKILNGIIKGYYNTSIFTEYIRSLIHPNYIVGIGSILQNNFSKKARIWGSGIISAESNVSESEFYAVRGKKTAERLKKLGYNFKGKIGDPALLLPLIYNPNIQRSNKIGVIPHVIHFEATKKHLKNNDEFIIIDLSDTNIEQTINQIKSCKYIISSSLHGLIVSHAYNTPSLHILLEGGLAGDGIKFLDYYSSVKIEEYKPINFSDANLLNTANIKDAFEKNGKYSIPKDNVINKIQKDLLSAAPFELSDKYRRYLLEK